MIKSMKNIKFKKSHNGCVYLVKIMEDL